MNQQNDQQNWPAYGSLQVQQARHLATPRILGRSMSEPDNRLAVHLRDHVEFAITPR